MMKPSAICYLLVSSLVASGCFGKQLRAQAATDLKCPEEEVQHESVGTFVEKVTACGRTDVYHYNGQEGGWRSVTERAAYDLSCPRNELTVQHLGGREAGVSGCGQKAVFISNSGSWVLNSDSREVPDASASKGNRTGVTEAGTVPTAKPSTASTVVPSSAPPPSGAAGFAFGSDQAAVSKLCTDAGHAWEPGAQEGLATCSGPAAPLGFDASVELRLCDSSLCRIDLIHRVPNGTSKEWVRQLGKLKGILENKYGADYESIGELPLGCETDLLSCLQSGNTALRFTWRWNSGHRIELAIGKLKGAAVIRISYANQQQAKSTGAQPAL